MAINNAIGKSFAGNQNINYQKIKTQFTHGKLTDTTRLVSDKENYFVFPFVLESGAVLASQSGFLPNKTRLYNQVAFSQIFSGKEAIIAQWEGATSITQPKDEEGKVQERYINKLRKKFQVGRYMKMQFLRQSVGAQFTPTPDNQYTQMSIAKTLVFRTDKELEVEDYLKLYIIPDLMPDARKANKENAPLNLANPQWMYISENFITRDQNTGEFLHSEITFSSLGDILSKSGQSMWTYVQMGAPGAGYAYPSVKDGVVGLDKDYAKDIGVKWVSIETNAPCIINNVYGFGKPIGTRYEDEEDENTFVTDISPSRHLLKYQQGLPITDYLTKNSAPDINLGFMSNLWTGAIKYWEGTEGWKNTVQSVYDVGQKMQFEGVISYENAPRVGLKEGDGNFVIPATPNVGNNMPMNDQSAFVREDALTGSTYLATGNGYTYINNPKITTTKIGRTYMNMANIRTSESSPQSGYLDSNNEPIKGKSIVDINNFNVFAFNIFKSLPLEIKESVSMSFSSIPGVGRLVNLIPYAGGFLNDMLEGVNPGWQITKNPYQEIPQFIGFNGFFSKKLISFSSTLNDSDVSVGGRQWIESDFFRDPESNDVGALLGANSITYGDLFRITDKAMISEFIDNRSGTSNEKPDLAERDTVDIGQKVKQEENSDIWCLWTDRSYATNPIDLVEGFEVDRKYLIDYISIRALSKADITIKCYAESPNGNNQDEYCVYTAKFQSYSKFTNNLFNWNTIYKLSFDYVEDGENLEFTYPQSITSPQTSGRAWDLNLPQRRIEDLKTFTGTFPAPSNPLSSDIINNFTEELDLNTIVNENGDKLINSLQDFNKYYNFIDFGNLSYRGISERKDDFGSARMTEEWFNTPFGSMLVSEIQTRKLTDAEIWTKGEKQYFYADAKIGNREKDVPSKEVYKINFSNKVKGFVHKYNLNSWIKEMNWNNGLCSSMGGGAQWIWKPSGKDQTMKNKNTVIDGSFDISCYAWYDETTNKIFIETAYRIQKTPFGYMHYETVLEKKGTCSSSGLVNDRPVYTSKNEYFESPFIAFAETYDNIIKSGFKLKAK